MNLSEDKMQKENNGSIFKQFGKTDKKIQISAESEILKKDYRVIVKIFIKEIALSIMHIMPIIPRLKNRANIIIVMLDENYFLIAYIIFKLIK